MCLKSDTKQPKSLKLPLVDFGVEVDPLDRRAGDKYPFSEPKSFRTHRPLTVLLELDFTMDLKGSGLG